MRNPEEWKKQAEKYVEDVFNEVHVSLRVLEVI